jgi:hypothetical protein
MTPTEDRLGCTVCNVGYYLAPNQSACIVCLVGNACPNGVTRFPCDIGSYQDQRGQAQCLACPFGSVQGLPEQSQCFPCSGATYSPLSSATRISCIPISRGYYGVALEGLAGFSSQLPCPRGAMCVNGTKIDCPAGSYQPDSTADICIACALNSFSSVVGRNSPCDVLPVGSYSNQARTLNLGPCPPGHYCIDGNKLACGLGTFQDVPGQIACKQCGVGYYNDVPGRNVSCLAVPLGYFGVGGTTQTRRGISPCQPGFYCASGVSLSCGASTFQSEPAQGACLPCYDQCADMHLTWKNQECNSVSGENTCVG